MELSLLVLVAALFVGVLILRSVIGLAVRFALFMAVAALALHRDMGLRFEDMLAPDRLAVLLFSAGAALLATKLIAFALFRDSRFRFLLTPITGVVVTVIATRLFTA